MANKKQTSAKVATVASEILRDPKSPKEATTVAASDLSQSEGKVKTKK